MPFSFNPFTGNLDYYKSSSSSGIAIGDTITSATQGSVLFAGASGVLAQDNSNFFWDDTNNRLGIGINSSLQSKLHISTGSAAEIGQRIRLAASQTGDAFQILNSAGTKNTSLDSFGYLRFYDGQTVTLPQQNNVAININGTLTLDNVATGLIGFNCSSILNYTAVPIFGIMPFFFRFNSTINLNIASTLWTGIGTFNNAPNYVANGTANTFTALLSPFADGPTFSVASSGTWSSSSVYQAFDSSFVVDTGVTWGTRTGFRFVNATGSGTLTTQRAFYCPNLTKGTNNYYLFFEGAGAATKGSVHQPNFQFGSTTAAFGSGVGVIGIANATTVPTTNPSGGGVLYVTGGALTYRGSSGTVTTIAPA